jgi:hypothetical protein
MSTQYTIDKLYEMNLKQYELGKVVHISPHRTVSSKQIGHIIGFDVDDYGALMIKIKFSDGFEYDFDLSHVTIL